MLIINRNIYLELEVFYVFFIERKIFMGRLKLLEVFSGDNRFLFVYFYDDILKKSWIRFCDFLGVLYIRVLVLGGDK